MNRPDALNSPDGLPDAFGGGRDVDPLSGIPATGVNHRIDIDPLGYFHIPILNNDNNGLWRLSTPGDRNADQYGRVTETVNLIDEESNSVDLLLSVINAGSDCDDLSAVASVAVSYAQIQNLWSTQCTGCHTSTSPNSAGLDLTSGSLDRVANRFSTQAPGLSLITSGSTAGSYLFEKINCAQPQTGTRMRPTNAMALSEQALIRDWTNDHIHAAGFESFSANP